jgi:hypothetical protein
MEEYHHRHLHDVMTIQRVCRDNNLELSLEECADAWEDYSELYAAGWLGLPEEEDVLFDIINTINKMKNGR